MTDQPPDVTRLLVQWQAGDAQALERLIPVVYRELRKLAQKYLRQERGDHTLQPTALVHEAYMRMLEQKMPEWKNKSHFLGVAAHLMRQILVDHARHHAAAKRGQKENFVQLDEVAVYSEKNSSEFLDFDRVLTKLAAFDPRKSQVLELHYFGGLTVEEIAGVLGVSVPTVVRDQRLAKAWLRKELSPQ
jgi:RNA polymerase sigma-70 factor, ECF subfamily